MEYTTENIKKAVELFYKNDSQQGEAHQWLTLAQNSPQAWNFVWELLDTQYTVEMQFYAATTLHNKLLRHWNELTRNPEYGVSIKNRILHAIVSYANGPKLILNRLCISLSAYIVHTISTIWPNAFEELAMSFQPANFANVKAERVLWILLEILSVIPEEFKTVSLATTKRSQVHQILNGKTGEILQFVVSYCLPLVNAHTEGAPMSDSDLLTYLNAVKCFTSWIQLGGTRICDCTELVELVVRLACITYWSSLKDEEDEVSEAFELFDIALDTLKTVLQMPTNDSYPTLMIEHMSNLSENFDRILEHERSKSNMNKDVIVSIYTLYSNTVDNNVKSLLLAFSSEKQRDIDVGLKMINHMLECVNMPGHFPIDESNSNLTFTFWFTFQDDVLGNAPRYGDNKFIQDILKSSYQQLIPILLRKCAFPENYDDGVSPPWSSDDKEAFRCYRQDICDTYTYCMSVLEKNMIEQFVTQLHAVRNLYISEPKKYWNAMESCLKGFVAIAEYESITSEIITQLMLISHELVVGNNMHKQLFETVLEIVGEYAERMDSVPQALNHAVPIVLKAMEVVELAPLASLSMKDISRNTTQECIRPYAEQILWCCQRHMFRDELQGGEKYRLAQIFGSLLVLLTPDKIALYLKTVWEPVLHQIKHILELPKTRQDPSSLVIRIKMLSNLFLHIVFGGCEEHRQQPVLQFLEMAFPLCEKIGDMFHSNTQVTSALCGLFRHVVLALQDTSPQLVMSILDVICGMYVRYQDYHILLLAKIIVPSLSKQDTFTKHKIAFLAQIIKTTLELLATLLSYNQLSEACEIIDSFFHVLYHFFRSNRTVLFPEIDSAALFECGVACLSVAELQALKACVLYLTFFIMTSPETSQRNIVEMYGESLLNRLFINIAGNTPRSTIEFQTDLLFALNRLYPEQLNVWLTRLLGVEGFPTPLISQQQKQHYTVIFLKNKINKPKLTASVTEFALICRGILKTETSTS